MCDLPFKVPVGKPALSLVINLALTTSSREVVDGRGKT